MEIPKLAIIVPCFNEELCVKSTVEQLLNVLNKLVNDRKIKSDSYIYLVDDGSVDRTWEIIQDYHDKNSLVKGVKFVRNFGNQKALLAGLDGVRNIGCDCAVSIDADLQQDEWAIEKFVAEYMNGADIVSGIRNDRKTDSLFKKVTALMFYKTMNILGAKIPPNHSDYRLVSKRALDILEQYPEKYLFLRGFFNEVGLKTAYVNFDVKPRMAGESKFNFVSLMGLALNGITSYSVVPLRFVTVLGFCMALFGFLVGVETVIEKIFWHNSPNGWATTIILLCVFGGIQLFCLGLIGEYVGQVYREVKARPRYIKDIELK
ncbi:putative bactoprenol glucosyl transferase-like protein [Clostridium sp. CAG:967]|nr:putative bactoprenol glucosyl transferase-like protein [Clostridium sp. CAG:967]